MPGLEDWYFLFCCTISFCHFVEHECSDFFGILYNYVVWNGKRKNRTSFSLQEHDGFSCENSFQFACGDVRSYKVFEKEIYSSEGRDVKNKLTELLKRFRNKTNRVSSCNFLLPSRNNISNFPSLSSRALRFMSCWLPIIIAMIVSYGCICIVTLVCLCKFIFLRMYSKN